jgi:AraC-like DNA-binding protein
LVQGSTAAIPHFQVSSDTLSDDLAFGAFQQSVQDVFLLSRLSEGPYRLDIDAWNLGTLMAGRFRSSAMAFDRPPALVASGGLDHVLLQLYVEGGFTGMADGRAVTVAPGDIVVFDLTRTISTRASDFVNISLLIPRPYFEASHDDVAALHGLVLPAARSMTGMLASYIVAFTERLPALSAGEAGTAARATAGLATNILSASALPEARSRPPIPSPFRAITLEIEARLHDATLDTDALAASLNMSRATLYRAFEQVGGIADYVRRRRLTAAAMQLADPAQRRRKISEIAFGLGFASESTFNRAFRIAFGISPREARLRGSALGPVADPTGAENPTSREFARWMRVLKA